MKALLSGNEAIALGAYHAGIRVATAYPGTPSTEILTELAKHDDIYAEWSTNEKVAMEVAIGSSYAGARTIVSMKHVGLNVASDPFMAVAATGVNGGLVVVTADDPGIGSSQNEQDNRYYGKLAGIPVLEPNDSQSAYDLTMYAFELSEKYDTPVILRSTTRISHSKAVVETDRERPQNLPALGFKFNAKKLVTLPAHARELHKVNVERLRKLAEASDEYEGNEEIFRSPDFGIITAGISYQHAMQIFPDASYLKLTFSYPLPENKIRDFASKVKKVIVIEELEPIMEEQIKAMGIDVEGKKSLPLCGELSADIIRKAAKAADWPGNLEHNDNLEPDYFPPRAPALCPGCPHVGLFYTLSNLAIRRADDDKKLIINGDIGCYTLGAQPPLNAMDACGCMGAGIGYSQGMYHAGLNQKTVSLIGDSTFLHSGMTTLLNAVYNKAEGLTIILDNSITAMTGHQPHPACPYTAQRKPTKAVDLVAVCRALGADSVETVNAFDMKALKDAVTSNLEKSGVNVLIVMGRCAAINKEGRGQKMFCSPFDCVKCGTCLKLGCPALKIGSNGAVEIDQDLCFGENCAICAQVCPKHAISKLDGGN